MTTALACALWLCLPALWGLAGMVFGPGSIMLIAAAPVAMLGALATVAATITGRQPRPILVGLLVTLGSVVVLYAGILQRRTALVDLAYLAAFQAAASFSVAWLVSALTTNRDESGPSTFG